MSKQPHLEETGLIVIAAVALVGLLTGGVVLLLGRRFW